MVEGCQGKTLILGFQDQHAMSRLDIRVVLAIVGGFVSRLLKRKVLSWFCMQRLVDLLAPPQSYCLALLVSVYLCSTRKVTFWPSFYGIS